MRDTAVEHVSVLVGSDREGNIEQALNVLGTHQGRIMVDLKENAPSTQEVMKSLEDKVKELSLKEAHLQFVVQESQFKFMSSLKSGLTLLVRGPDATYLANLSGDLAQKIRAISGVQNVVVDVAPPAPETKIEIDKDRAALYDFSVEQISKIANIAVKGEVATEFKTGGHEIDIRVKIQDEDSPFEAFD